MARPVREDIRQQMIEDIKGVARQQMRSKGTAGLSLRAIAREMEITAPALYNYFPRLDDLITALIVDAFQGLAEAIEAAGEHDSTPTLCLQAKLHSYRDWAVRHPEEFSLIYGNPISGYQAPGEITVPLVQRGFIALFLPLGAAWAAGQLTIPPEYQTVPSTIIPTISQYALHYDAPYPNTLFYLLLAGWSRIHGLIMLEIFNHSPPTVGDAGAFYRHEVEVFLTRLGLTP